LEKYNACNEKNCDFYKNILEASHDEIFVTDGKGVTIYCNKTFERNYGMSRSEIMGKNVWHLLNNGYCNQSPLPMVIENKKEVTIEQETGTGRKLVITATPVLDFNGEIEFIVENCRDITELERIKVKLEKTQKQMEIYKKEVENLRKSAFEDNQLIFNSDKLKSIMDLIKRLSNIDSTVLILGESGTGKTAIAKYIHENSSRKDGPFITINCGSISTQLLDSELFGYTSGSFTGAKKEGKIGLVELAEGGTLFLDEIGEIPLALQGKFLQLIQEKTFTPVGGIKPKKVDIRIISATNQDLGALVKNKTFREDLYYRLKVINIDIPPLRERKEDIEELTRFFLDKYNLRYNLYREISEETIEKLINYSWPGNIRELQHIIEQLVVTVPQKIIKPEYLPTYILEELLTTSTLDLAHIESYEAAIEDFERKLIKEAYDKYKSSYKIAENLGISQSKASRLVRKYITR